jgi:LysM repeat protein
VAIPWADIVLFIVIGGLLAFWWFRPPNTSSPRELASSGIGLAGVAPTSTSTPEPTPTPFPPTLTPSPTVTPAPTATPVPTPVRYKVEPGDSLELIAGRFGSTVKDIIEANDLSADGLIHPDDELLVPVKGPSGGPGPTPTPSGGALVYTVQPGDTVESIAIRFGSQIDWILGANKIQATDLLHIGQSLLVPLTASTPSPGVPTPTRPLPTWTPISGYRAPALLTPADAAVLTGSDAILLSWTSVGILGKEEWYVVTLTASGDRTNPIPPYWTKATTWRLPREYKPSDEETTEFTWQVQVISGTPGKPGTPLSPPSPLHTFKWQ